MSKSNYTLPGGRNFRSALKSVKRKRAWREVVYIEDQPGKRGGEIWVLTLSCGHLHFKCKPGSNPGNFSFSVCKPIAYFLAPKKVICRVCEVHEGIKRVTK